MLCNRAVSSSCSKTSAIVAYIDALTCPMTNSDCFLALVSKSSASSSEFAAVAVAFDFSRKLSANPAMPLTVQKGYLGSRRILSMARACCGLGSSIIRAAE